MAITLAPNRQAVGMGAGLPGCKQNKNVAFRGENCFCVVQAL